MTDQQQPTPDAPPPAPSEPAPPAPAQPAATTTGWQQPASEPAAPATGWQQPASGPTAQPPVGWQQPESEAGPAPGIEFAGHGGRLVAYILDGILVSVIVIVIAVLASAIVVGGITVSPSGDTASVSGAAVASILLALLVIFIISLVYFPFFWARGGQTPGMRVFRLRVVRDRDGGRIGWGAAWLRLIGLWVSSFVFYLGFIWIFIDKRRRGWHDLIAGTVVIKDPEPKWG
jgi:uncharacterized RDD family membrane protein YckC